MDDATTRNELAGALAANHGLSIVISRLEHALHQIASENSHPNGGMAKRCVAIARDALGIPKRNRNHRLIKQKITIHLEPREDGGLRVWSDDLPGLILSHSSQTKVIYDIGAAVIALLSHTSETSGEREGGE